MKIVFLGFASYYTPGMAYQDNVFNSVLLDEGHEVTYLAANDLFINGEIVDVEPGTEILSDGLKLVRLPYRRFFNATLTKKARLFSNVESVLEREAPDIIYCHGVFYQPIWTAARYCRHHPQVRIYADTHASYANSATSWLSLHLLHSVYYRFLYKRLEPLLTQMFYVGLEEKHFFEEVYHPQEKLLSFLPLGGLCPTDEEYRDMRASAREELSLRDDEILLVHTGKMDQKKETGHLLRAFSNCKGFPGKLVLIGSIPEEVRDTLLPLIEADPRILFLGWKNADELRRYLCACDLYCQPGSVSATLQNAICCRCPVLAYPHEGYLTHYNRGNILWTRSSGETEAHLHTIAADPTILKKMASISAAFGQEKLDYRALVRQFVPSAQTD